MERSKTMWPFPLQRCTQAILFLYYLTDIFLAFPRHYVLLLMLTQDVSQDQRRLYIFFALYLLYITSNSAWRFLLCSLRGRDAFGIPVLVEPMAIA